MIELENVSKSFGKKRVLSNINLNINKGEMLAIVGPSGCGKSTLLNILGFIEDFQEGTYRFQGKENVKVNGKTSEKIIREKVSYLFQNFALIDSETVEENLLLALYYVKKSKQEKQQLIAAALKEVGLSDYEKFKVFELSVGEQQRIAIARVLLKPSELILADEPTGSLDDTNKIMVLELLKKINMQGKTVIIVTHDQKVAQECSRIIDLSI